MLKRAASLLLCCTFAMAQSAAPPSNDSQNQTTPPKPPAVTPAPITDANHFILEDGTPIKLRTARTISSADAHVGDTLDLEVLEQVKIGETVIVPEGGIAWATVTEAEHKKRMGRGGKLNVNIDSVRLTNGQKAPLRAVKEAAGGGHVGAMTGAIVATALIVWPAAPFFLFMHGKDITVPKGTEITAYINGNVPLEKASFSPKPETTEAATPAAPATGTVIINSTPPGADIEVDGSFVGNAPSTMTLSVGDHTIAVSKKGFARWERKLKVSGGSVNINAELEAAAPSPQPN